MCVCEKAQDNILECAKTLGLKKILYCHLFISLYSVMYIAYLSIGYNINICMSTVQCCLYITMYIYIKEHANCQYFK